MIDILMATYNGEKYLAEQLDSILRQSFQNFHLIIRDDGSKDDTVGIIQEYQQKYPGKITLLQAEQASGSAQKNFFALIQYERENRAAKYIMFADQDDVWLSYKIKRTLMKMKEMEGKAAGEIPRLVHTDLQVVDSELKVLNTSLFQMQKMDHRRDHLNQLLVQNIVTGCTMMINRALLYKVAPLPKHAVMHDMWLALIAAAFGEIGFIKKPTILYRQHTRNANGAKDVRSLRYIWWKLRGAKQIHEILLLYYGQAKEFGELYGEELDEKFCQMLKAYGSLSSAGVITKWRVLKKYRLWKKGFVRRLGQILL